MPPQRPEAPTDSPSVLVLTLARRVEVALAEALGQYGLSVSSLGLLGHIAAVPGASFSQLARMSGITVQSAHAAVRGLTAKGLVTDRTARAGAASTIELTEDGHARLADAMAAVAEVDRGLFGATAAPPMRALAGALRDVVRDG